MENNIIRKLLNYIYIYMQESRWSNTKLCSISKPKGGVRYLISDSLLGGGFYV